MQLDKHVYDNINEYCKLNGLKTRDFIHKLLIDAFNKEKYGDSPFSFGKKIEDVSEEKKTYTEVNENVIDTTKLTEKNNDLVVDDFNDIISSKITKNQIVEPSVQVSQKETKSEEIVRKPKKRKLK